MPFIFANTLCFKHEADLIYRVFSTHKIHKTQNLDEAKNRTHKGNGVKFFMNKVPHHKLSWQIFIRLYKVDYSHNISQGNLNEKFL